MVIIRLGGSVFEHYSNPGQWAKAVKCLGYRAAYCPVDDNADDDTIEEYAETAKEEDIIIAEVGAWSNPISYNEEIRKSAISNCQKRLYLAEKIGARCCVNIAGSRSERWEGPHPDNYSDETFEMIVDTVRAIIDEVKPVHTFYALEPMQWIYPDSPDSYLDIIKAVDRKQFGVHLDPVNMVLSPRIYSNNSSFLKECFKKLGPYIKSCHAKDIILGEKYMVHLDEIRPGLGKLDYKVYLSELNKLDPDTPLMIEHLSSEQDYFLAAEYIRSVSAEINVEC